jgi:hypothetical protein
MSLIAVSGKVHIPAEIQDVIRTRGLFRRKEWKLVFKVVEQIAMGAGGVLEQNLNRPEVQLPLAASTLRKKQRLGLSTQALVGRRGRIVRALSNPNSVFRRRAVGQSKRGGGTLRVFFNPAKFQMAGKRDPFTQVLQRGRLAGFDRVKHSNGRETSRTPFLVGADARKAAKAKALPTDKADGLVEARRMPGRPVMSYYPGNEDKLTPALLKGVYYALRKKGLAD